jgi:hypothetical protein
MRGWSKRIESGAAEFELTDTGIFDDNRYFDVFVEYAKTSPDEILIRIEAANRGSEAATLHLLPTLWFRNTWSWDGVRAKPSLYAVSDRAIHAGKMSLECPAGAQLLFTENETNNARLYGAPNATGFAKDGINDFVIHRAASVNPARRGTKAAAYVKREIGGGESAIVYLRLTNRLDSAVDYDRVFKERRREADEFYASVIPADLSEDAANVMRQSFAGMLWSKQFYHYVVKD